jgi:hypothetical protein
MRRGGTWDERNLPVGLGMEKKSEAKWTNFFLLRKNKKVP